MIDQHTLDVLEFGKLLRIVESYATSVLGKEEIAKILPSDELEAVRYELKLVSEFVDLIAFDDPVPIHGIKDVRDALKRCRIEGSILPPEDLLALKDTLRVSRSLHGYFSKRSEKYPFLSSIACRLTPHKDLEERIDQTVDGNGEVKDSASRRLSRIRRELEGLRASLREKLEEILRKLPDEVVQDRIFTLRDGRYVIPIRGGQRSRLKGVIHGQSATGMTVFVEPLMLLEANNRVQQLEITQRIEVERILRALTNRVREVRDSLVENIRILGRLDSIYARASYARDTGCMEPSLNVEGKTIIRGGRHPLLAHLVGRERVVPLDVDLGKDFITLIITGPNAGGKTVALKTIGLLSLMAQSGMHIPVDQESEIGVYQKIFADIGDEQSIEQDLSTFSSHVRQLVKICRHSDPQTLVLLDEIGAGTSPEEGAALAMSILEDLTARGVRTVATTHHGALKLFAHRKEKIENGSMEFDSKTLAPTFRLRLGIPGSSYAFEIAQRLGMPGEIVERAGTFVSQGYREVEDLLINLKRSLEECELEQQRLKKIRFDLEKLASGYEERLKGAREEAVRLKKEALEEAKRIVKGANALVERAIREIRSSGASSEAIKEAREALRESIRRTEEQIESFIPTEERPLSIEVGQRVWVKSLGREGEVLTKEDSSGRVQVQVGKAKAKVSASDLRRVEGGGTKKGGGIHIPAALVPSRDVSDRIDVRGMTFDEASAVVDRYLDDVYLAGLNTITIIHGKGTGALREKIGAFLQKHPRVKSQRMGEWNEGGSGVTIVEIQ